MKTLKTVCKNCTESTRKAYSTTIRRLYKIFNDTPIKTLDELPQKETWLMSTKLENKYKKFPVNIRRHLSTAAYIATKLYGIKSENKWNKHMIEDAQKYEANRNRNTKSTYEKNTSSKVHIKKYM